MKKTVLALCVAAAGSAHAELTPMSEFELHTVTGQAGVDIELDLGISVGEIRYTDTDGDGTGSGGGSLAINTLTIGGIDDRNTLLGYATPDNGPNLDELIFAVDVAGDGTLVIDGKPANGISPVDIKLTIDSVTTLDSAGNTALTLIDELSIYGGALGLKMTVNGSDNDFIFRTQVGFDDIDVDLSSFLGMKIENAFFAGSNHNNDPELITDYIADIHVVMSQENDGVKFDFGQATRSGQNIFDLGIGSLTVGQGLDARTGQEQVIGSFFIDDLNIRGLSVEVSGH